MNKNIKIVSRGCKKESSKRIALVIGNANYLEVEKLKNPENDADKIATTLGNLNFEVMLFKNQSRRQMKKAIRDFFRQLEEGSIGLFYYSGHGLQIKDTNYLLPVDAYFEEVYEVEDDGLKVNLVLDAMAEKKTSMNVIILDACRDNPFRYSSSKSLASSRGLATMSRKEQCIIVYSTAPGEKAEDGRGENGTFTSHLLQHMQEPNLEIVDVMRAVTNGVNEETKGQQQPHLSLCGIKDKFYFLQTDLEAEKMEAQHLKQEALDEAEDVKKNALREAEVLKQRLLEEAQVMAKQILEQATERAQRQNLQVQQKEEKKQASAVINRGNLLPGFRSLPKNEYGLHEYQHEETGMEFVLIPQGKFEMGSNESDNSKPIHTVSVKPFLMGKYTVTQEIWKSVMNTEPWDGKKYVKTGAKNPVVYVSWKETMQFCKKFDLSLPSESQWEYACRAGTKTKYYWGDQVDGDYLWYVDNATSIGEDYAHEVGKKKANAYGLYDMLGNIWEWCEDEWHGDYKDAPSDGSVWGGKGLAASDRVFRGGSFVDSASYCACADRGRNSPSIRRCTLGFRVCRPVLLDS